MGNIHIISNHKYLIPILFLFQIFLSKQSKINPILFDEKTNNFKKETPPPDILYKKYEEIQKKQKILEKEIKDLKERNYEYNLKIETNQVYIIILYIIMSIIILVGIIFSIFKLYYQCHKKPNSNSIIEINDKSYLNKNI